MHVAKPSCTVCGKSINPPKRAQLQREHKQRLTCLACGESDARGERASWCVVQQYGKGPYQLVTNTAAKSVLRGTNQKNLRS